MNRNQQNSSSEILQKRLLESKILADLTQGFYAGQSIDEAIKVAVSLLSEIFTAYVSVNLIDDDERYLIIREHNVDSKLLKFAEKLIGKRFMNWKIPLEYDSPISQTIRTGHPTVCNLGFVPDKVVVETTIRGMLESMVEPDSPIRVFAGPIAERTGKQSLLGIPFSNSKGKVTGSVTFVSPKPFDRHEYNLAKVAADIIGRSIEQYQLSDALNESERRYLMLKDNLPVGIFRSTLDGDLLSGNPAFFRMLGYQSIQEFKRVPIQDVYEDINKREDCINIIRTDGVVSGFEIKLKHRDGKVFWASLDAQAVYDDGGGIKYFDGSVMDITDRKRAAEELRKSEEMYRFLAETAREVILIHNMEGDIKYVNKAGLELSGYSEEDALEENIADFLPTDEQESLKERYKKRLEGDFSFYLYETEFLSKSGRLIPVEVSSSLLMEGGKPSGVLLVARDITERRRTQKVQGILLNISHAVGISDNLGDLLDVVRNQLGTVIDTTNFYVALYDEATDTYSFPYDVGEKVDEEEAAYTPIDLKKSLTDYVRRTGKPLYADEKKHDELLKRGEVEVVGVPSVVWLGVPLKIDDRVIGVVVVQSYEERSKYSEEDLELMGIVSENIALAIERRRAQDALLESEELQRALFEGSADPIIISDLEDITLAVNPAVEKLFGYSADELIGRTFPGHEGIDEGMFPEWVDSCRKGKGVSGYETVRRTKCGTLIPVSITISPIRNAEGNLVSLSFWYRDITERKQ
ncbi:PAS domain S-box protein, partial [candidate division WOR-3 bacterium]|nr:PAS domain S-box protein [candidate division WOR-3 bacterium]MBD3364852.1 PAS domain S-box protein [candidate division WOR-3 bacterium]